MSEIIAWLESPEGEAWSRERSEHRPDGCRYDDAERRRGRPCVGPVRTRTPHPGRDSSDGGSGMTWHCASCRTTVTWAPPVNDPVHAKCPRSGCGGWMDPVTEDAETEGTA